MPLSVFGINHCSAPVAIREQVAFTETDLPAALSSLRQVAGVTEAAILSTCNRTELYCLTEHSHPPGLLAWLLSHHRVQGVDLRPHIYQHGEEETVRHVLRVASGLDSMILGEPQILGQLKSAYSIAQAVGSLGRVLNRLFQHAFHVAKKIRTDTAIGSSPVSVAFAVVRLAQQIHGDLGDKTALLIGAGATIELAAHHLRATRLGRMLIANRTLEKAQSLASSFGGYPLPLAEVARHLPEADLVIAATGSRVPVLSQAVVVQAMRVRRRRPMLLVDIAVPRDIEAGAADLEDVYLYTIDDLQGIIDENIRSRQAAALQAREIVDIEARHFLEWVAQTDAVELLRSVREHAEKLRDQALETALQQMQQGQDAAETMRQLAHQLTNRLLHGPTVKIKDAGIEGRDQLLQAAQELFEVNNEKNDRSR